MRLGRFVVWTVAASMGVGAAGASTISQPVSGGGGGFSGSGTLTGVSNPANDGSYTIEQISGTYVTGLIAPGSFEGNDNQLFPAGGGTVTAKGFAFTATEGDTNFEVDLFAQGSGYAAHIEDLDTDIVTDTAVDLAVGAATTTNAAAARSAIQLSAGGADPQTRTFAFSFAPAASAAVTPEPASFALLGTGFLGMAGLLRRRRR